MIFTILVIALMVISGIALFVLEEISYGIIALLGIVILELMRIRNVLERQKRK